MANTKGFTHLILSLKHVGEPKLHGGGKGDGRTACNKANCVSHVAYIKHRTDELSRFWMNRRDERTQIGLPDIGLGIPFLLEIDPKSDVEFLRGLGFEIVCSLDDGFIIVASQDADLTKFIQALDKFSENKSKSGSPAKIYALSDDSDRISRILSTSFYKTWDNLQENTIYTVDVSVSCSGITALPNIPDRKDSESDEHYSQRLANWKTKFEKAYQLWDDIASERQATIKSFLTLYEGEILSPFINENDSFSFRIKIIGKGLRDFVLNYPYVFEISEIVDVKMEESLASAEEISEDINILAPENDSPVICVIDSGIQEGHKYLAPAILSGDSKNLIPNVININDEVTGGGHGTRVAGAILYPDKIPTKGKYQLPVYIRNIKVLDDFNGMPDTVDPAWVIANVSENLGSGVTSNPSKIYNHSIGERKPFTDIAYMSPWAAQIDKQSYDRDILFIQAAGNIPEDIIKALIQAGHQYPKYLGHELSRLANPAQSLQALTVGSVSNSDFETEDKIAMGKSTEVSSYSRIGPGIWDTIKPDVVEYGGTHAINKVGSDVYLTTPQEVCPELIRRSPPGKAFDRDVIGTSFAAPKVSYIAAEVSKILPNSPALLYRALIAQSARWFDLTANRTEEECENILRCIGFGLPNLDRATHNNEYRVTLITPEIAEIGEKEAHIYSINIPDELKAVGDDFDILIEVTLSYAANPRRTRRHIKGYLSTWVDWISSRQGETPDIFVKRIFDLGRRVDDSGNFKWMLGESRGKGRGQISNFSRSKGTLQKDWCIIKSNQLTDGFCIGIRGHKGWGSLFKAKYSLAVSFEAINQDIAIYEPIRILNEVEIKNREITIEVNRIPDEN
jgi:hypothetical protein